MIEFFNGHFAYPSMFREGDILIVYDVLTKHEKEVLSHLNGKGEYIKNIQFYRFDEIVYLKINKQPFEQTMKIKVTPLFYDLDTTLTRWRTFEKKLSDE